MSQREPEQIDTELDAVLRRSTPTPDPEWVAGLEHRLLPVSPRRVPLWRLPQVRFGAAVAAGFAALLVVLALAGVGPLGGSGENVRAREDCELVQVTRIERVPAVVEGPSGDTVVYRREHVQRYERRCR
jgi:hypothetical protein